MSSFYDHLLEQGASQLGYSRWIKSIQLLLIRVAALFLISMSSEAHWLQMNGDLDGEAVSERSGSVIALSADGNRLAIGGGLDDRLGESASFVRVYSWRGERWVQVGAEIDVQTIGYRSSVAVSLSARGETLAIGAPWDESGGYRSGQVRVFDWRSGEWVQRGAAVNGEANQDHIGAYVELSRDGQRFAVGHISTDLEVLPLSLIHI